jgi:acyl-CoA reductase-like NAD-dependent aldehyde dehydrogenase
LPVAPQLAAPVEGVVCVAPHASELVLEPLVRVLAHLERGERVLLVAPKELAELGEVWRGALAGIPGWACVEDDGLGVLRALLANQEVRGFEASGPPARVAELAELVHGTEGRVVLELRTLRNTSLLVRRGDDAQECARVAARRAFGRVASLSGQRAGALGRVVCHERQFSRFSAALLAELERTGDFERPVPPLERETRAHLAAARALGLDEGATLVLAGREPPACLFTNVDERLQLATLARCAPLLVLLRTTSDEEGAALAARLDGDARAEDLGARV